MRLRTTNCRRRSNALWTAKHHAGVQCRQSHHQHHDCGHNVKDMLSGAVPGYWNVTTEYVNNIYADGVKVIGGAPVNPTIDTRPQCVRWAEDYRLCYCPLYKVFMKQKCAAICSTNTGCTAKETFRTPATNGDMPRHAWCQNNCGYLVGVCNGRCGQRCNTDCNCNEPSSQ